MEWIAKYFLHIPQIAVTWGIFFVAGFATFVVVLLEKRQTFSVLAFVKHCCPIDLRRNKSVHMDLKIYIIQKCTAFLPGGLFMIVIAAVAAWEVASLKSAWVNYTPLTPGIAAAVACAACVFIAREFADYVVHYAEHKTPILWELHKVHHSSEFLNPLTAKRGHILALFYNGVVGGAFGGAIGGIFMFVFGFSLLETMALGAIGNKIGALASLDAIKHSHFPVDFGWGDRLLISPHMHQVHHSRQREHWDKNFGTNLSIFDWLFGTAYKPREGEVIVLGISGHDEAAMAKYHTLKGAYVMPLVRMWRMLASAGATASQRVLRQRSGRGARGTPYRRYD